MSINPVEIPTGAVRYNTDSNKMEVYIGSTWMEVAVSTPNLDGGARGIVMGGNQGVNNIDFFTISTQGDATDFGDLITASVHGASGGSRTRGICVIGTPNHSDKLEFITISSTGDATDFGDQSHSNHKRNISAGGSATRMIIAGGVYGSNPYTYYNSMEFVTIASTGNTVDFGDMTEARTQPFVASSPTRFVTLGGYKTPSPNASDIIEFVTTASTGNSQDFGDLMEGNSGSPASCSNSTRSITFGGRIDGTSTTTSIIQTVQIATGGNARKFGDLTESVRFASGTSSKTRGVRIAGYKVPSNADVDTMDYINISTEGDAVDFGNLTRSTRSCGTSTSSDHGGL